MNLPGIGANESAAYRSSGTLWLIHLRHYALAILSVGVALGASLVLEHFHFRVPSALLLLFAVAISSWYGGPGPAVLAAILSIVGFYWYFVEPVRTIYIYRSEIPFFVVFAASAALMSWFATIRGRVEADLREQAALLNLTHDTVFVMDMEGVIKYWNRGAEERYCWTAEQALGRVVHDLLKTVFPAPLDQIKAEVTRTGRWEGELLHTKKDGSQLVVASRWSLERGKRGDPVAILETNNDITERKRAEQALRRSEAYLAESQRLTDTGSWVSDGKTRKVLYWSEEMCRIYGFDPNKGLPTEDQAWQRIHPEDRVKVREASDKTFREKIDYAVEYRIVLSDGIVKHIQSLGHPVLNADGDIVEVVGTNLDITERKHAEEAFALSSFALDNARDAVFLISEQGRFVYVNEESCRSLGYTREELLGMGVPDIDPDFPMERWLDTWHKLKKQPSLNFESYHRTKEGRVFPVEITAKYLEYGGQPLNLAVVRDISERKHAEEERETLRADLARVNRVSMLGELAASIAHEVNQPLSGVVSNASACLRWLAADAPNMEEAREAARRIVRDGKRAAEVVAHVRALTKRTEVSREKLDLNETVREVLTIVGDEAKKNRVAIRTEFAHDIFPALGDRVELQQVVLNLVMNGIEAMSSVGEQARELAISTRNIGPDRVQVTIQDSGIGLDPNKMPKIFDPFYTTKSSGMGMGLTICRSILQAHGGQLWAAANDGPGTSFHFTLPRYDEACHAAA